MRSRRPRPWAPIIGASLLVLGTSYIASCTTQKSGGGSDATHASGTNGATTFATADLYSRQCAPCHGENGDANTRTAEMLAPKPRPFRDGLFKLVSTDNAVPTDDDLVRSIRHGMTGSAMPGYEWLTERELQALARQVRKLAVAGIEQTLADSVRATGQKPDYDKLHAQAELRMKPGKPIRVPAAMPATRETLAQGKTVYNQHCAACHGTDGKGRKPPEGWTNGAEQSYARDFTAGILRGGASHDELCLRIRAGMPGAHMPATPLSDAETQTLVTYVRSLIPDEAIGRYSQWRHHIRVQRVDTLPAGPDDPAWENLTAVRIPLAPLQWRDDAVLEATVRAAHDGKTFRIHLTWPDGTQNERIGSALLGDGAALQFTSELDPPMFAMGNKEPVNIWHWRAFRNEDAAGVIDLLDDPLHQWFDLPVPIPGVTEASLRSESIRVRGAEEMAKHRGAGIDTPAAPSWHDRNWRLSLGRPLAARSSEEIAFKPGQSVLMGIAVWDGAVDERPGSKSVSTWHTLAFDDK
jgi:cytochrome c oxidase cbb3-type subunit 2